MSTDDPKPSPAYTRLQLNRGGYFGERIDIAGVLPRIEAIAIRQGWTPDPIDCPNGTRIAAFRKGNPQARANVYVSAGIHGDEPAGPIAVERLLEQAEWPTRFNYWLVPCLNPFGFERNTREGLGGVDLNRDYRQPRTPITSGHIEWLARQPRFDLALLLHEDWEANGFYLYELNPDSQASLADAIIEAVRKVCPIEHAEEVDGRPAASGMIRFVGSVPERDEWPEALHLIYHKTRHNYTLEGPSDYPLALRVNALVTAVNAALQHFEPQP
jgi:protein MpaA